MDTSVVVGVFDISNADHLGFLEVAGADGGGGCKAAH